MQSHQFDVTISKIAIQVWIMILVPLAFVAIPIMLILNFEWDEWIFYVIFFGFILLSLFLTIRLVKNSTRKGMLIVDEKGLKFLFNNRNIFYNRLNNQSISWDEVNKVAYNFDTTNDMPFIVLKFGKISGTFICMQENSKGMDENTWQLWQTLDSFVSGYNHVHREHKIKDTGFYESRGFRIFLWTASLAFVVALIYKTLNPEETLRWFNIFKLLIILIPLHTARWIARKRRLRNSDNL